MAVRPELSPSTVLLYTASPFFLGTSGNRVALPYFSNQYLFAAFTAGIAHFLSPCLLLRALILSFYHCFPFSTKAVAWLLPSLPGPRYSFGAFFFSEPCLITFPECDHPLMTNLCLDPQTPCLSWVAYSWLQVTLQVDGLKVGMSRPDPSPSMSLNSMVAVTARCICITEKSITFLLGFNI